MLKQFPIRLSIKIILAGTLLHVVIRLLAYPLFIRVQEKIPPFFSYYSGNDTKVIQTLEKDKAALEEFEKNVNFQNDSATKGSAYYDFLQEVIKKHGILAAKINSGNQIIGTNVKRDDFTLHFSTTYDTVGSIVSDLENGHFLCSVKPLHIFSKSLLNYTLDVDMSLSFYRLAK
jgi:hypothetical protein